MKSMKLFVSDLDGTLLTHDFEIREKNIAAIQKLHENNIEFAIATGRIYIDAFSICDKCGFRPYIISNNGSRVFDQNGNLLTGEGIGAEDAIKIVRFLETKKISYGIGTDFQFGAPPTWEINLEDSMENYGEDPVHREERLSFIKKETRNQYGFQQVASIEEWILEKKECGSISVMTYEREKLQEIAEYVNQIPDLETSISGSHNMEIVRKQTSKGRAISYLSERLHIDKDHIAAIGDGMNDLEMLQFVGHPIAMGNAAEELKKEAEYVTTDCGQNGFADAVDWLLD